MSHDEPDAQPHGPDVSDLRRELAALHERNTRLTATLHEARAQILAMKEEIDRLAQPPAGYGLFLESFDDGTVDVVTGGRKLRVAVSPDVDRGGARPWP